MPFKVEIIADSLGIEDGASDRITTMVLTYPRFIHAEFMTHRVFSRNASSSRAIPIDKCIKLVEENPAMPVEWGMNQKGMQAYKQFEGDSEIATCRGAWLDAARSAIESARKLQALGLHKQIVNRVIEPFAHITVIVTSTQWNNFFRLRDHHAAQPEIRYLAQLMRDAYTNSEPKRKYIGQWHLPYYDLLDDEPVTMDAIVRSVARCARVSYLNHDGTQTTLEKDRELYNHLIVSQPPHMTPAEHQAIYVGDGLMHANFKSWSSHRRSIKGESGE